MQATTVIDIDADLSGHVPESYQIQVDWKTENGKRIPYYPVGTVFEGDHAIFAVHAGQAAPSDDECRAAVGMNSSQIAAQQLEYEMTAKGVNSAKDRELYKSKVILGYQPGSDGKLVAIKGPNWDKYQADKAAAQNVGNV